MRRAFLAVALFAPICLLIRASRVGVAGDYLDPVAKISAQDEAFYVHSVIRMVRQGEWLTPRYMGRFSFFKPPLVMWLSALSARIAGISRFSLRFPIALLCGLAVAVVFVFAAKIRSRRAGLAAALLLVSNYLWNVSGAMVLTDALLAAFDIAAVYAVFADPWLGSIPALWGFALSIAAAILTKSVAGALPLATFGLYWLIAPQNRRPTLGRACCAAGLALALAMPWYAYQLLAHGRWFWTEHVLVEIFGFGGGAAAQTTSEGHVAFYLKRFVLMDPVLLALTLAAIPALAAAVVRKRSAEAALLIAWLVPVMLAPFMWRYQSSTYLVPAAAPMAITAAAFAPFPRRSGWLLALVSAAFLFKLATPRQPWGLSFASGTIQQAAAPLSKYCGMSRGNELIVADIADDLYASDLPLPRVRYLIVSNSMTGGILELDFGSMGISVTADQLNHLSDWTLRFRRALHEWGIDSDEPIASLIVASTPQQVAELVRAHPSNDFLLTRRYRAVIDGASLPEHTLSEATHGLFFLLSHLTIPRREPAAWPCAL
jgi:hypothetical protein